MNLGQNCLLSKCGPGNITLEALLDSPGLTPSPLSEFVSDPAVFDATGVGSCSLLQQQRLQPHTSVCTPLAVSAIGDNSGALTRKLFASELQRQTLLRDYCIELLFVLRNQDVNGYFLSSAQGSGHMKDVNHIGLLDLEKRLLCNGYHTLDEFKSDVAHLFVWALRQYSPDTPAHAEAQRLNNIASDWFSSLAADHVAALNSTLTRQPAHVISQAPVDVSEEQILPTETTLGILNPDNHGVVSRTERVRSIGEEAGPLRSGLHLLPNGGYREDRRNKVIPYTYLDYGPFYSFAPHFDSGASHCSPEAHQLVLSTSWLPARTAYLTSEHSTSSPEPCSPTSDDITQAIQSDAVNSALAIGDHQLAVSLAVADMEQRTTAKIASELDAILPGPEVGEDCVFSMCLANALTRNSVFRNETELCSLQNIPEAKQVGWTEQTEIPKERNPVVVDLDQPELPYNSDISDQISETYPSGSNSPDLTESASDLISLYQTQYRRLGDTSPTSAMTGATLRPSQTETTIAHRLVGRLIRLAKRARPGDLVHPLAVRRAMNMLPDIAPLPDDEYFQGNCPSFPPVTTEAYPKSSLSVTGAS
ncbi:hypothetical protein EG68_02254 [Paragonimus skrjabini miyazakii]|uniref:Uncharacterized protein n=1 Tax=Paragonimus skrjabini miyazakii TaxID=59628 RepID=A0A8S9Z575_9TREM|nr:hypothetical protein EG68_02254 [Paragonimus skrjabini miyazakii]